MFPEPHLALARALLARCQVSGLMLTTAESCTGGLIAACLTEVPGSSSVVERGYVTYSNAAKTGLLGVPEAMLAEHGAVSEPVARAMAEGALARPGLALAATGIAGPGGGTADKPVGLVHIAAAIPGRTAHERLQLPGDRRAVRLATVAAALRLGLALLGAAPPARSA